MTTMIDGCCGAGLAHDGYAAVGIKVAYGVDVNLQPDYPREVMRVDILDYLYLTAFEYVDAGHFSPPCQLFTDAKHLRKAQGSTSKETVDFLTPSLALLRQYWNHKLWVVENVDDRAKMCRTIMAPRDGEHLIYLCGSMFGLPLKRHRLFLANFPLRQPECNHSVWPKDETSGRHRPWGVYHVKGDSIPSGGRTARDEEHGRQVMGSHRLLPWDSLKEGFPPAYTSHVGADLLVEVARREAHLTEAAA